MIEVEGDIEQMRLPVTRNIDLGGRWESLAVPLIERRISR
jgi:hypothetical protein